MSKVAEFNEMVRDFKSSVDFVTIYTAEAHPMEEWALLNHEKYSRFQHQTLKDRMDAAHVLRSEGLEGELFIDSMLNEAITKYAALPERLYVIQDGVIRFRGSLGPFGYQPSVVRDWLQKNVQNIV